MTLRETLNVLAVKTDIIELRVFVSDDECVENIGFDDCEYPKDIICFLFCSTCFDVSQCRQAIAGIHGHQSPKNFMKRGK